MHRRVEEIMCEGSGAGVLFDEHRHAESGDEFVDEVDSAPALHAGDHGGAAHVAQVGSGHGHADGHDGWIVVEQLFDALVDGGNGVVDGVVVDRGQVLDAQGVAAQAEYADLHQRAGEFDADDAEARGVELESDGTAVLGASRSPVSSIMPASIRRAVILVMAAGVSSSALAICARELMPL